MPTGYTQGILDGETFEQSLEVDSQVEFNAAVVKRMRAIRRLHIEPLHHKAVSKVILAEVERALEEQSR